MQRFEKLMVNTVQQQPMLATVSQKQECMCTMQHGFVWVNNNMVEDSIAEIFQPV